MAQDRGGDPVTRERESPLFIAIASILACVVGGYAGVRVVDYAHFRGDVLPLAWGERWLVAGVDLQALKLDQWPLGEWQTVAVGCLLAACVVGAAWLDGRERG